MLPDFLVLIGAAGFLAATWLFPVLARILSGFSARKIGRSAAEEKQPIDSGRVRQLRFAILIPAHNEENKLGRTLECVEAAIRKFRERYGFVEFHVLVGADGCTDRTREVAEGFQTRIGVRVIEFAQQGKWRTLFALAGEAERVLRQNGGIRANADWLVLADAGILWSEDFLLRACGFCVRSELMAVAPAYSTPRAGIAERAVWWVERHFKGIETRLGGPVSIHGATVLYRAAEFLQARELLGDGNYLNDDVVIPLALRALFPEKSIWYGRELVVWDELDEPRAQAAGSSFRRRRRLVLGNIQWIRGLLPTVYRRNPLAGLLAMRRVFRVLWAYWGLTLGLGLPLLVLRLEPGGLAWAALGCGGILFVVLSRKNAFAKILEAASVSLLAPYYYFSVTEMDKGVWK